MKYTIDAQGKKLGRVASQAASYLLGKHTPSFAKNVVSTDKVEIIKDDWKAALLFDASIGGK